MQEAAFALANEVRRLLTADCWLRADKGYSVKQLRLKTISQAQWVVLLVVFLIHLSLITRLGWWGDIAFLILTLWSFRIKHWQAFHLALLMLLFRNLGALLPGAVHGFFPLYLLLVFAVSWAILFLFKKTAVIKTWLRRGRWNPRIAAEVTAVCAVSALALIVWGYWTDNLGAGEVLLKSLTELPTWATVAIALPAFALLNALSEELTFRGVFLEAALKTGFSQMSSVVLQAMAFAAFHFQAGFPNGRMGYAMTFIYAIALGALRLQVVGMLAPYLAHVAADLVIAYFLYFHSL